MVLISSLLIYSSPFNIPSCHPCLPVRGILLPARTSNTLRKKQAFPLQEEKTSQCLCSRCSLTRRQRRSGKRKSRRIPQLAVVSQAPVLVQKDNSGNKDAAPSARLLPPSLLPWCFYPLAPPVGTSEGAAGYMSHSRSLLPPPRAPLRAKDPA